MNESTAAARALLTGLVAVGVREVVLAPGSRSAPLAYAVRDLERAGLVRLHVRIDERSAAFLALGLAKRTRRPAAVITTSGTAVANLHPAVLEAWHAQVPLMVVSSDRPADWRGSGANQTTIQPGMFAQALRAEADLAVGADWADAVKRVASASMGPIPGPVHLNPQFREPLVPDLEDLPWIPDPTARQMPQGIDPSTGTSVAKPANSSAPQQDWGSRPVVILGDVADPDVAEAAVSWAAASGLPLLAEPFGPHPRPTAIPHAVLALGDDEWLEANRPDEVIVIGRPTLSRPVSAVVKRPDVRLTVVPAGADWSVPGRTDHRTRTLSGLPTTWPDTAEWTQTWQRRGAAIESAIAAADLPWPSGAALARTIIDALPADALCFLGSSNAVRDIDAAAPPAARRLDLVASRGLAGIDGCLATAIGLALAEPQRPAYAIVGDLTFLHDSNALAIGPDEPRPDLTIVVPSDDGGGIFTLLEPGAPDRATDFDRLFRTRTGTDLAALCAAHGIDHERLVDRDAVAAAIAKRPNGIRVIEVPIDPATHRPTRALLRELTAHARG